MSWCDGRRKWRNLSSIPATIVPKGLFCFPSFNSAATAFNVTWKWPTAPYVTHSYPHVAFKDEKLPILFSNITNLDLRVKCRYDTDPSIIGNVALDMFADVDMNKAHNRCLAAYKIMVWFGDYGGPWPLGFSDSPKSTVVKSGII
jgi:hypothetical protein